MERRVDGHRLELNRLYGLVDDEDSSHRSAVGVVDGEQDSRLLVAEHLVDGVVGQIAQRQIGVSRRAGGNLSQRVADETFARGGSVERNASAPLQLSSGHKDVVPRDEFRSTSSSDRSIEGKRRGVAAEVDDPKRRPSRARRPLP